jgi:hypothetical protein
MRASRAPASPGSRRASPPPAWSSVPGSLLVHGPGPAARRSVTPISNGRSRQRRCSVARTTSQPTSTWRSAPLNTAKARPCRSLPTNGDGPSPACASLTPPAPRRRSWPHRAGGHGPPSRLTGASGARGPPLSPRIERACAWAMSPHLRCMCRTVSPASSGVAWPSVPRLDRFATRTHAGRTVLPRPRARNSRDGLPAWHASGVDWDGIRAPQCFEVAPGGAPSAAAAHVRRPAPQYVCGAGRRLLPKPGAEIKQRRSTGQRGALGRAKTCLTCSHRESFTS